MDNNNAWDGLSLTEKSEIMRQAVANGITNLQDIRDWYNDTVNNYIDNIYANGTEEPYGDPSSHYNNVDEEKLRHMTPDARGHYDDSVKLPNHPSSPTRGTFNGQYFDMTDKGFEDPNYTMFGLQDNGDGNTIMRYNGDTVMPELTVTPNGNYYDDTYNNIKILQGHQHASGGVVAHDARYNHATQIYQSYIDQGINPQTALELTNQKIAEKGWTGWVSGDNKRYNNVNSFTDHTIDQFNKLYPDSLKSNNFNQFFQGIEGGRTKYNPTPNTYRQHLLQTRPGVKKRINEYRRLQGQSPLSLVSPTSTPLPWEEGILYNPQISIEEPVEQPVIAADGGYLHSFRGGGKLSQQNQRAGYAVNYFMNKGLSKVAAAGLVGNLMRESQMNIHALNPASGAYGLGQWLGSRKSKLFKKYGKDPTFEQQLDYIWDELNSSHKKGLQMLRSSKTVDEAARNAFGYYEFSGGPQAAVDAMNRNGMKTKWKNPDGTYAMNQGINNAWVAYGKANPNIKLQGLNINSPKMGLNGMMPQQDFASIVDNVDLNSVSNTPIQPIFPSNPTNYGAPVDYSTIKHPENPVPQFLAETPTDNAESRFNKGLGLLSLVSSIGKDDSQPIASYTPQRQSNGSFTVNTQLGNDDFLNIPLLNAYGGKLYAEGGKEDDDVVYEEPVKPVGQMKLVHVADPSKGEIPIGPDSAPHNYNSEGTGDIDWNYINQFINDEPTQEEMKDMMDKSISDYLTTSNDATAVGSPSNAHLEGRSIYGGATHAEWERQHPALTKWSYLPTIATLGAAATPFVVGGGEALAGTTLGQGITSGLTTIANAAKGSTFLPWADAAVTSYFGAQGINDAVNGNFTPESAIDVMPLMQLAKPMYNAGRSTAEALSKADMFTPLTLDNKVLASPSKAASLLSDASKYRNLRSSKATMDARINDLKSQGFVVTDDMIQDAMPFYHEVNDVQVPYIDNVIESQVIPRMEGKQKLLAQTVPTKISVHPEEEFDLAGYGDTAGLTFMDGYKRDNYIPDISVRRGSVKEAGPHEVRHRIDYIAPLTDEQKGFLNEAYFDDVDPTEFQNRVWGDNEKFQNYDFSDEKPTTNLDVRQKLFDLLGLKQSSSLEEQNKAIQKATDSDILEALYMGNGYSSAYTTLYYEKYEQPIIRKMAEGYREKEGLSWDDAMNKAKDKWEATRNNDEGLKTYLHRKADQVRKALIKVGALAAPVAVSQKKKSK